MLQILFFRGSVACHARKNRILWADPGRESGRHDWIRTNDLYRVKVAL